MTLKEIVQLGKMGYSKKDIEEMSENEQIEDTSNTEEIEKLNNKIDELTKKLELNAVREPKTEKPQQNDDTNVEDCLKALANTAGVIE